MSRVRLGVVLLVPSPVAGEIDGLRRGLDDSHRLQVAPHLTLVPPVNVRADEVADALRVVRAAAEAMASPKPGESGGARRLRLTLGPPATFRPDTDTLYLAVSGDDESMLALRGLRDAVFVPPLERVLEWPFVPHVTISEGIEADRIDAAVSVLGGYQVDVEVDRVHVLQEQRDADGHRRWVPIADAPFAAAAIVGRGGIELELTTSELVDPEVARFLTAQDTAPDTTEPVAEVVAPATTSATGSGRGAVVITARRRGEVVGVAQGWIDGDAREIDSIVVGDAWRDDGVDRQLELAFGAHSNL